MKSAVTFLIFQSMTFFYSDNSYFELFRIFFSINPFPYCDTFIACLSWWIVGGITGYIRKYGKTQAQYWAIFHAILSPKQPRPEIGRINFYLVNTFESKPSSQLYFKKKNMPKKSTCSHQTWWKWYWRTDARKGIWEVWNGLNWMQPRLRLITGGTIKKAICIQLHQPKLTSISSTQPRVFLHQIFTIISATSSIFSSQSYKNVVNPILQIFQQVFYQLNHTSFLSTQSNLT